MLFVTFFSIVLITTLLACKIGIQLITFWTQTSVDFAMAQLAIINFTSMTYCYHCPWHCLCSMMLSLINHNVNDYFICAIFVFFFLFGVKLWDISISFVVWNLGKCNLHPNYMVCWSLTSCQYASFVEAHDSSFMW